MLRNYILIAWRNMLRSKLITLINITGLSAGIAFTLLVSAYAYVHLQANQTLKNINRQYIIQSGFKEPNPLMGMTTLGPVAKTLCETYPHLLANYYRYDGLTVTISKGDKHFKEVIQVGDTSLLGMFGFPLLDGDAATAMRDPYAVVISEEMAMKYFDRTGVLGETLSVQDFSGTNHDFTISGVLKKLPVNTVTQDIRDNFNQGFFFPKSLYFHRDVDDWNALINVMGFVELREGVDQASVDKALMDVLRAHIPEQADNGLQQYISPLSNYQLHSNGGRIRRTIDTLAIIALFILLMAVINFINITIGRAGNRIREIGIRKTIGVQRKQLIIQFLVESNVLAAISSMLALLEYCLARPWFSKLLYTELPPLNEHLVFMPLLLIFILIVGTLAGLYPAFILSLFSPVDSVKGSFRNVRNNTWLRKTLIGLQFATAMIALCCGIIITQQVVFFFSNELGYDKAYVLSAQVPRNFTPEGNAKMSLVRDELMRVPVVSQASVSWEIPNGNSGGVDAVYKAGADSTDPSWMVRLCVDEKYADTYQLKLIAGKALVKGELQQVMMNETAAKELGFINIHDAIGAPLRVTGWASFTVCGIIKDFHFGSMHDPIRPVYFVPLGTTNQYRYMSVKLRPGNIATSVEQVKKKWDELMPGAPFEYLFMSDALEKMYKSEIQVKKASYIASWIALLIILMGISGLVSLTLLKKTREIGTRKILGSSVGGILVLVLKEFIAVVVVATLIACPLTYYIMQNWLSNYAYHIVLTPAPSVISFVILTGTTMLLIIFQSLKAARSNPVNNLKAQS